MRKIFAIAALLAAATAVAAGNEQGAALERISANSMRGQLSFIASDLLEGRGTPSRGLDLAAEYIAAQYRRAGLEPLGDDSYFQTANWTLTEPVTAGFALTLHAGPQHLAVPLKQVSFKPGAALTAKGAAIIKANWNDLASLEALGASLNGAVLLVEQAAMQPKSMAQFEQMLANVAQHKPLLVLVLNRARPGGNGGGRGAVTDPAMPAKKTAVPVVTIHGEQTAALVASLPLGATGATLDLNFAAANVTTVKLRNVAALLRGSDPVLKDTYVVLSAHYDHLGIRPGMEGDNIFNGANDDGSGTVSVIEIASALAGMKDRPKRSILFLNVFGEELGMLGSAYYGRHPLVPVAKTIANINLEQVGRSDGTTGASVGRAALTGYDFSNIPATMAKAGAQTGVEIYKDPKNEQYFGQSDNAALAALGVPAHTLSVLYEFADYHKASDHWDKIDYANMTKVTRAAALGVLMLANDTTAPKWNEAHDMTAPYVKAHKALFK